MLLQENQADRSGIQETTTKALNRVIKKCRCKETSPRGMDALTKVDFNHVYEVLSNIILGGDPRDVKILP